MIEVLAAGIHSSIQDNGRYGFRKYGIPVSGAMDIRAMHQANYMLKNAENAAVLEFMLKGPVLKFHTDCKICLSGAPFNLTINNKPASAFSILDIKSGDILNIGNSVGGMFGYMAIRGEILTEVKFGSKSQYRGITKYETIRRNEFIHFKNHTGNWSNPTSNAAIKQKKENIFIHTYPGPEFNLLSKIVKNILLNSSHEITNEISRMGYRLKSEKGLTASEIITAPVQPGTIQLTPSGKLIALMRDAQTTGGYARVLQLDQEGIGLLAQKRVGSSIQFRMI